MLGGRTKEKGEGNTIFFSANVSKWKDELDKLADVCRKSFYAINEGEDEKEG